MRFTTQFEQEELASQYGKDIATRVIQDRHDLSHNLKFTFPKTKQNDENCEIFPLTSDMPVVYWMCALSIVEIFKGCDQTQYQLPKKLAGFPTILQRLFIERVYEYAFTAVKVTREVQELEKDYTSNTEMKELIEEEASSSLLPQLHSATTAFREVFDDVLDEFYCTHTSESMDAPHRHFSFLENFYRSPVELLLAKSIKLDIQGMAGGEEAWRFATELRDMYFEYLSRHGRGFHIKKLLRKEDSTGSKEVDPRYLAIQLTREPGSQAIRSCRDNHVVLRSLYADVGVHRIQRVPDTEQSGRMHTSTASLCLVPNISLQRSERSSAAPQTSNEVSLKDLESECDISWTHGSGPGGQAVNTGYNCCVLYHRPTKIALKCHQGRSAMDNKTAALKNLREKLHAKDEAKRRAKLDQIRRLQAHTGERNEKIRSFNAIHNSVIDHRTEHKIDDCEGMLSGRDRGDGLYQLHQRILENEETQRRAACVLEMQQALFDMIMN